MEGGFSAIPDTSGIMTDMSGGSTAKAKFNFETHYVLLKILLALDKELIRIEVDQPIPGDRDGKEVDLRIWWNDKEMSVDEVKAGESFEASESKTKAAVLQMFSDFKDPQFNGVKKEYMLGYSAEHDWQTGFLTVWSMVYKGKSYQGTNPNLSSNLNEAFAYFQITQTDKIQFKDFLDVLTLQKDPKTLAGLRTSIRDHLLTKLNGLYEYADHSISVEFLIDRLLQVLTSSSYNKGLVDITAIGTAVVEWCTARQVAKVLGAGNDPAGNEKKQREEVEKRVMQLWPSVIVTATEKTALAIIQKEEHE